MTPEHVDVLIVGAGLSGIGAAYYIQTYCPNKSYAVLEAREAMGGTWDLFRYPGVRSDSDMYTLGYTFHPWHDPKVIADGPSILAYIHETAETYGIDKKIRYQHRLCGASWSSAAALWTVEIQLGDGETLRMTCNFLYMCSGYYDYGHGYLPEWAGMDDYKGILIHPQQWDTTLDYSGKSVIVIGSGATAVTLVPAMAEKAAHVTMLQRSPTYVVSLPTEDGLANGLRRFLPERLAFGIARWKAILTSMVFYNLSRWKPAWVKNMIVKGVQKELGDKYDVEKHFTPRYNPWDQRLCMVPDSDLFKAIKAGKASVVTDQVESFTEDGIRLCSGEELKADIIVTATGLVMKLAKGGQMCVDGEVIDLATTMNYKGAMLSDVPNMAFAFGYTNASWTLKCELTSRYVCRLLNYMDAHGYRQCTPRRVDPSVHEEPVVNFTSGYIQRAASTLPSQGSKRPWKLYQNYLFDLITMRFGRINDGAMEFRGANS
jgi:cation diffusion facilitator CzcD-associated flavoprotein CzcO